MAQESWKIEKDETNCEILKPSSSSSSSSSTASSASSSTFLKPVPEFPLQKPERPEILATVDAGADVSDTQKPAEESPRPVRFTNRCSSCQKKVGLTGFRCRCGDLFCGRHRYSDTHDCSFDYKAAGREAISKANPVIRAAKIIRI